MFIWQDSAWNAWLPIQERLPHAILIRGAEGSGELEFAQGVAQSLLCENPRGDRRGCGVCPACGWFAQGNHPDFRLLVPDSLLPESQEEGAEPARKEKRSEQIRIEQVRELADFLAVGTHRAGRRIILIYPADAMNANTQNALLKNLEEPPPETVFLLVSAQPDRLLPTVRSRCMKFTLPLPDPAQVARWLKEQGVKQPEAALASAGGAPLAALKAAGSESDRLRFIEGLRDPGFDPIALAETVLRVPPWDLVGWLQRWSYDLLLERVAGRIHYHVDHEGVIADTSRNCEAADISTYLRGLTQARSLARHPLNAKLFVEDLLLQYQRLIARP
ncbi:MAG TPA: DNA polymerase III subunit delta' [Burkholderiales bacterium]|nr:DNA polymerase III subunit delta' [Burkholderiales bacterium]